MATLWPVLAIAGTKMKKLAVGNH